MYFAPDGQVRACCVNHRYTLGRVGQQTLREIWDGARIDALRSALDQHDYSLGCEDCELRVAAGDRAWSTAEQYDDYLGTDPGAYPRRMDFILSITCNLQCAMCDGDLSSSIRLHREKRPPMPVAYGDAFFEELEEFLPHLERSVFLGGEPFVARESQRVWDLMIGQGHTGSVSVVTNGTQWNPRVERYLTELPMEVAMSIDGYSASTLESLRVGVDRDELFVNLGRYQQAVGTHGGSVAIHFCLMRQNWHEFGRLCVEAARRDIEVLVMTVTKPHSFSLWNLPPEELEQILLALETEDRSIQDDLGANRAAWEAELERIRRHLESQRAGQETPWTVPTREVGVTPVEVEITPLGLRPTGLDGPARPGGAVADSCREHEAELASWADREPVLVEVIDGVIRSVHAPEWAAALESDRWIDRQLSDLVGALEERLGAAAAPSVDLHPNGIVEAEVAFGGQGGGEQVLVRSLVTPGVEPDRTRVAVATNASPAQLERTVSP